MTFHESPPPGTPRWLSTPLITATALVVIIVAALLWGVAHHNDPDQAALRQARQAVTSGPVPTVTTSVSAYPDPDPAVTYDASVVQQPEMPVTTTKAERAKCFVPSQGLIDRVMAKTPAHGAGFRVDRAVAYDDDASTFFALITEDGFATWVMPSELGNVGVLALDQEAADISGYDLTTPEQHAQIDPGNKGRARLIGCLQAGFPGDTRQAG